MSTTLPPIPALPANATWDQQMRHVEAQMSALRFAQTERSIAASVDLVRAQDQTRAILERQAVASERMLELMPASSSSGDGLTVGDVAILKGIVDALRPAQG